MADKLQPEGGVGAVPVVPSPQSEDEERNSHPFNSRTPYEPGDDRDIWCKDCEYHRDDPIHHSGVPVVPPHPQPDAICEHGTALDVHCCNCHSGFLFDIDSCVCEFTEKKMDEIPRRHRLDRYVPAETAIRAAMLAVENMPADVRLTDAVVLLGQAKDKVADFVDGVAVGVPVVPERAAQSERIFKAVVHTYEGDDAMVPTDLREASFVRRARRFREAADAACVRLRAERDALERNLMLEHSCACALQQSRDAALDANARLRQLARQLAQEMEEDGIGESVRTNPEAWAKRLRAALTEPPDVLEGISEGKSRSLANELR